MPQAPTLRIQIHLGCLCARSQQVWDASRLGLMIEVADGRDPLGTAYNCRSC